MRRLAFFAPLAATLAVAGAAATQPLGTGPEVTVTIGSELAEEVEALGERDVQRQAEELAGTVRRELVRRGAFPGARINLILTDLKPNRPTHQQASDRPGLSLIDSISIGGAAIEGEILTADGQRLPVRYSLYSTSIDDVYGFGTWHDAERAYDRLASNMVSGRLVTGRPVSR